MFFAWLPLTGPVPPGSAQLPVVLRASADEATLRRQLRDLSMRTLEAAWSCTDNELAPGLACSRLSALVRLRGFILDEVERRSSRRYRAWLRTGGPAGKRPSYRR